MDPSAVIYMVAALVTIVTGVMLLVKEWGEWNGRRRQKKREKIKQLHRE